MILLLQRTVFGWWVFGSEVKDTSELTAECDVICNSLKEYSTETVGFCDKKHQDWFDDNNESICELLRQKNEAHAAKLNFKTQTAPIFKTNGRASLTCPERNPAYGCGGPRKHVRSKECRTIHTSRKHPHYWVRHINWCPSSYQTCLSCLQPSFPVCLSTVTVQHLLKLQLTMLSVSLYCCMDVKPGSCTVSRHIKGLEAFHIRCPQGILCLHWWHKVTQW